MRINLKKMKKILFAVISFIVVVLISVASNNRNSNIQDVALLLKNVEVLTAGAAAGMAVCVLEGRGLEEIVPGSEPRNLL